MQYFRFLPDPAKLRKEVRWSGVSSVPGIGERVQPIKKRGLRIEEYRGIPSRGDSCLVSIRCVVSGKFRSER